ncbi:MAG: prolipoprotein diacylglyceryl transferase [Armatimonadota bacterium]|nr:prolipoprotein diacylglyceryl transferase [Armatimonadota bacterium]
MKPVLFRLGPFPISSFGIFLLLAFLVGIALSRRRAQVLGIEPNEMVDLSLYMIIAGIVGGRIGYVLSAPGSFLQNPLSILAIWRDAGLTFYGALVGGAVVASLYARRRGIRFWALADLLAQPLSVGYAVAMIGALLHGLYLGKPTGVPWAVEVLFEKRHPTQIYLLLAALGIFFVLRSQARREHPPGSMFLTFLFLLALARVVVEVFVDSKAVLGPATLAQLVNVVVALFALAALLLVSRRASLQAAGSNADEGKVVS